MEERRAKGLCFNCDEKFSATHACKNKRQLFSLELEEVIIQEEESGVRVRFCRNVSYDGTWLSYSL